MSKNEENWQKLIWHFWRFKVKKYCSNFQVKKIEKEKLHQIFDSKDNFTHLKAVAAGLPKTYIENEKDIKWKTQDNYLVQEKTKEKDVAAEIQKLLRKNIQYLIKKWVKDDIHVKWRDVFSGDEKAQTRYGILLFFQSKFGQDSMKKLLVAPTPNLLSSAPKNHFLEFKRWKENAEYFSHRLTVVNLAIKMNDYFNIGKSHIYHVGRRRIDITLAELDMLKKIHLEKVEKWSQELQKELEHIGIDKKNLEKTFKIDTQFVNHIYNYNTILRTWWKLE